MKHFLSGYVTLRWRYDHWCNKIDEFHEHLNKQNTSIQFTKDIEENGKIPLLDCLVTRDNNTLPLPQFQETNTHWQTAWPKRLAILLHTKRRTLTRRAQIVCDSDDSLTDEIKHFNTVFIKSNYTTYFIERITYIWPNDSSNNSHTTTDTRPYIRGTSETIARILWPYNIRVAHKPIFTLRRLLTNVKDKDKPEDRPGAVYKIKCSDCQATYNGETGRNLTTRLNENNNNIAKHH